MGFEMYHVYLPSLWVTTVICNYGEAYVLTMK